jgi:phosphopantothenoylcysteine decarboxylase/phosphopantothenate--cysteine ligase
MRKNQRSNSAESNILRNKQILIGVCGGIAAYKTPELVRSLRKQGAEITCILTENGERFVAPLTLQTLSENRVYRDMFDDSVWDIEHISLAKKADIIVVVPATADAIARFACGRAEDLLSSVILAAKSPVLICPAMNERMWLHPATKENTERLKKYGYYFTGPQRGLLACGDTGMGKLAEIDGIIKKITDILNY